MARQPVARAPGNLALVRNAEQGVCCRPAAWRRNGRKRHDARRIRNGSETGPAPAWLNRAAVPLGPEPIPVPPGPPSRASSSSPNGTRSQRRRPGGATGAPSGAGSAPRQPTNDLKSPYGEVTCLAFSPTEFSHRHAMRKLVIRFVRQGSASGSVHGETPESCWRDSHDRFAGVVQIRITHKTRNPFTLKALSISGVTWKWHFLNHAPQDCIQLLGSGFQLIEQRLGPL